ncbi:hypothetical protein ACH5RR_030311 [Cinchona calisaya]|uniref:Uncharacterized protein n=1 Tax=Cinchona calisaya TaxID=153742 RepID=A0ABD2YXX8_9GENT
MFDRFGDSILLLVIVGEGAACHEGVGFDILILYRVFIPVLNLSLSSNRYYVIQPHGIHKGKRHFYAKSVAPDVFPPYFLRRKGWSVRTKTPKHYKLDEAPGLNAALRAKLLEFNFPPSYKSSKAVVVGKWYSPFMFIKDGTLKDQMERSMFYQTASVLAFEEAPGIDKARRAYMPDFNFPMKCEESEKLGVGKWYVPFMFVRDHTDRSYQVQSTMFYSMTLDQQWQRIFLCWSGDNEGNYDSVNVDVVLENELVYACGCQAEWDEKNVYDRGIWFNYSDEKGAKRRVGLSPESSKE